MPNDADKSTATSTDKSTSNTDNAENKIVTSIRRFKSLLQVSGLSSHILHNASYSLPLFLDKEMATYCVLFTDLLLFTLIQMI